MGNPDVTRRLVQGGYVFQVEVELILDDTPSGFAWTSGTGPEQNIDGGTTAAVRVTTETHPPIVYLFPFLRKWSGL